MLLGGANSFARRVFVYVIIFTLVVPCPQAFAPPLTVKDLTPAERAIYELYLNPKVQYQGIEAPGILAEDPFFTAPRRHNSKPPEWLKDLTPESYGRLVQVYPQLETLVKQGRERRLGVFNALPAAADAHFVKEGVSANSAEALRKAYLVALTLYRKREVQKVTELEAKTRADEITRRRLQIDGRLPVDQWPVEAQRHRAFLIELFKDETKETNKKSYLPERVFREWRAAELARIDREKKKLESEVHRFRAVYDGDTVYRNERPPRELGHFAATAYMRAILEKKIILLESAERSLKRFVESEKGHAAFLSDLEGKQGYQPGSVARTTLRALGGVARDDGKLTRLKPELEWLAALGWAPIKFHDRYMEGMNKIPLGAITKPAEYNAAMRVKRNALMKRWGKMAAMVGGGMIGLAAVGFGVHEFLKDAPLPNIEQPFAFKGGGVPSHQTITDESDFSWNKVKKGPGGEAEVAKPAYFEVTPLNGKTLAQVPREFELGFSQDADSKTRPYQFSPGDGAKADFEIKSEMATRTRGGYVTIPWVQGFDVVPELSNDGRVLRPGTDYEIVRAEHNGLLLRVKGFVWGDITYKAKYFAGDSEKLPATEMPTLTAKELAQLEIVAGKLEKAKHTKLAEALNVIAAQGKAGKPVTAADLQNAVGIIGHYGGKDAEKIRGVDPANRFMAYEHFADAEGIPHIECDTAAEMLKDIYTETLVDHPKLKISTRRLLLREDGQAKVGSDRAHRWVSLVEPGHKPLTLDGTPSDGNPNVVQSRQQKERVHADGSGLKLPWWWPVVPIVPLAYLLRKKLEAKKEIAKDDAKEEKSPEAHAPEKKVEEKPGNKEGKIAEGPKPLESEAERRAREGRNAKREILLKEMRELRSIVITSGEALDLPKVKATEMLPHLAAVQALSAIEDFVTQARPVTEAELANELIKRLDIPEAKIPSPVTLKGVLKLAKPLLQARVESAKDNWRGKRPSAYEPFLDADLVRPSLALLDGLANAEWSPMEPAPGTVKPRAPGCLGVHASIAGS